MTVWHYFCQKSAFHPTLKRFEYTALNVVSALWHVSHTDNILYTEVCPFCLQIIPADTSDNPEG